MLRRNKLYWTSGTMARANKFAATKARSRPSATGTLSSPLDPEPDEAGRQRQNLTVVVRAGGLRAFVAAVLTARRPETERSRETPSLPERRDAAIPHIVWMIA